MVAEKLSPREGFFLVFQVSRNSSSVWFARLFENWTASRPVLVNDMPALFMPDGEGVYMILIPHIEEGKVVKIFMMRNPDKISLKSLSQNDPA